MEGTLDGHPFHATLEPDGQLSHWLKIDAELLRALDAKAGDSISVQLHSAAKQREPDVPADLKRAFANAPPAALATWDATTTLARVDWVHWIESAKQASTRAKRIDNALDMLAKGKKRVCCFDSSGHYDQSLSAPQAAE